MDEQLRRVRRNEALFREVNREIVVLERGLARIGDEKLHIVCECADLDCNQRLAVPLGVYEDVRADQSLFLIVPGHDLPSVEKVVDEGTGYAVVRKYLRSAVS